MIDSRRMLSPQTLTMLLTPMNSKLKSHFVRSAQFSSIFVFLHFVIEPVRFSWSGDSTGCYWAHFSGRKFIGIAS